MPEDPHFAAESAGAKAKAFVVELRNEASFVTPSALVDETQHLRKRLFLAVGSQLSARELEKA